MKKSFKYIIFSLLVLMSLSLCFANQCPDVNDTYYTVTTRSGKSVHEWAWWKSGWEIKVEPKKSPLYISIPQLVSVTMETYNSSDITCTYQALGDDQKQYKYTMKPQQNPFDKHSPTVSENWDTTRGSSGGNRWGETLTCNKQTPAECTWS